MNPMTASPRARRSPFFASGDLAEVFDAFLGSPFVAAPRGALASTAPPPRMPIDVHEDADGITVVADVPGFTKDEVHVEFHQGVLTMSAVRGNMAETSQTEATQAETGKPTDAPKGDSCCGAGSCCGSTAERAAATLPRARTVIRERSAVGVRRALQMPDRVTGDAITAELADGVLTVRLPYAARPTPRKISVN